MRIIKVGRNCSSWLLANSKEWVMWTNPKQRKGSQEMSLQFLLSPQLTDWGMAPGSSTWSSQRNLLFSESRSFCEPKSEALHYCSLQHCWIFCGRSTVFESNDLGTSPWPAMDCCVPWMSSPPGSVSAAVKWGDHHAWCRPHRHKGDYITWLSHPSLTDANQEEMITYVITF